MDLLWLLQRRLAFSSDLYDNATAPFVKRYAKLRRGRAPTSTGATRKTLENPRSSLPLRQALEIVGGSTTPARTQAVTESAPATEDSPRPICPPGPRGVSYLLDYSTIRT